MVLGRSGIPDQWIGGLDAIADKKFDYTDYTFKTIVASTIDRAVNLAKANGGQLIGDSLRVKLQDPVPPALEQWDDWGTPVERIDVTDERWKLGGKWEEIQLSSRRPTPTRRSATAGAEATIIFEGTGAMLVGPFVATGGKAQVFLDDEPPVDVDSYQDGEQGSKRSEAIWHRFGLIAGEHKLRVVVAGAPIFDSEGSDVAIESLLVFDTM